MRTVSLVAMPVRACCNNNKIEDGAIKHNFPNFVLGEKLSATHHNVSDGETFHVIEK